ncbi:MAG: EAL domain-containing protein [Methylobacter sp.]|nr:MAG: EAL domain-containing protein [Methylobacter sp.]
MKTFVAVQAIDDNPIPRGKDMTKKLKKKLFGAKHDRHALIKKQINALRTLQKNEGKQHIFSIQLAQLIDKIPDSILLKDREGRKLITNQLTKGFFKQCDLDGCGDVDMAPTLAHKKIRAEHKHSRSSLKAELHLALAKHQFKLYYQSQVDSAGRMLGAEALLRWEHPKHGLLAPHQFIDIAEQTGLIQPIGMWVLQTACEQLKLWQSDPLKKDLLLAVNISSGQFSRPEFVEQLLQILDKTGVNATGLKLELSESLMLHYIANTIEKMEALKQLGIRFSMDNFGTGYSSLSQLKRLPIDQLKIDQFLMRDIGTDSYEAMIVKTIIDMTHNLGIDVLAGGVETEQQFIRLKQLGCSAYQGYLFGEPVPLNEFEELISQSVAVDGHTLPLPTAACIALQKSGTE